MYLYNKNINKHIRLGSNSNTPSLIVILFYVYWSRPQQGNKLIYKISICYTLLIKIKDFKKVL